MLTQIEYVWMDGASPTQKLRSKTKILSLDAPVIKISDLPEWGFDGSSTWQAEGHDSDCVLKPVCLVEDPVRIGDEITYRDGGSSLTYHHKNYIAMCEVFEGDGKTPHKSNTRALLRETLEAGAGETDPWFGLEQEYTLFQGSRPLGFPETGFPAPQGPYYCGVGADEIVGRPLIEAHTAACIRAGLKIAGTNSEVMPGQWEFQIGHGNPLIISDHLWLARWLLYRIGEDYGINATLDPKPAKGDWNGAGCHTNFSTREMREEGGIEAIKAACIKLSRKHAEHIAVYGAGIEQRLTGKHETCSYKEFRWGIADRGASIRIPRHVYEQGKGYLEDRRPCANVDPYVVTNRILRTICDMP